MTRNTSDTFKNKYRTKSSRLKSWDYSWNGSYFITICTHEKKHYFGQIINNTMQLSPVGIIANSLMFEINNHTNKNITLNNYIVMPNHIHALITISNSRDKACLVSTPDQTRFQNQGKNTISSIIDSYKSAVSKHVNRLNLSFKWQSRFHDHIIRDQLSYNRAYEYITTNPEKWAQDKFYTSTEPVETRHALSLHQE